MLERLAEIRLEVADAERSAAAYAAVLGRTVSSRVAGEGVARLSVGNVGLTIEGARGDGAGNGETTARLVFSTPDLDKVAHRLARRGLPGEQRPETGPLHRLDASATHGVAIGILSSLGPAPGDPDEHADISGLDHVVVRTPDPERAVALYGGRLGLDLRLDRSNEAYGSRMLFFVCGDLVLEVVHDLRKGVGTGRDRVFGLAWRARDIDSVHARLLAGGIAVSEIRDGRRPSTRVMTVKSHTAGMPTLVIGGAGLARV